LHRRGPSFILTRIKRWPGRANGGRTIEDEFDEIRAGSGADAKTDAAALTTAMGAAGASEEAREFLRKQSRLADLQMENVRLQNENLQKLDEFEISHLRWRRFNDQMRGAMQIMLVAVGSAVVIAIGAAVWSASHAEGLVVDSFSVPPQFVQAGMGGDVIAADLTHRIVEVRDTANAHSIAHSKDVRLGRDEEIKVEIPDTGISLGEVSRYLRSWLGHERHLGGSLQSLGDGKIALTVALGGADAETFTGSAGNLDKLEQQAAEHVFQGVDPSNYVLYLYSQNRYDDALLAIQHLIRVSDSTWMLSDGYSLWGNWTHGHAGDLPLAMERLRIAAAMDPKALPPHMEMAGIAEDLGHDEDALRQARLFPSFRQEDQYAWREGNGFSQVLERGALKSDALSGSFDRAISDACGWCSLTEQLFGRAEFAARMHDIERSRAFINQARASDGAGGEDASRARYFVEAAAGDWRQAVADARAYDDAIASGKTRLAHISVRTNVLPLLAYALARSGDLRGAHAEIDKTPDDCVVCVTARGNIDALEKNWSGAGWWFARATRDAPSIPFAYTDWGTMLAAKGDLDGAIAKFALANQKGPHFADPLELWGEALIVKNRSDLALAKFAEADKYAPNWGRLHLKWGEALLWSGEKAGAAKQFDAASHLGLTPAEKSELAHLKDIHG
jgi:tetratricopeptide (TPR) repeat protein